MVDFIGVLFWLTAFQIETLLNQFVNLNITYGIEIKISMFSGKYIVIENLFTNTCYYA